MESFSGKSDMELIRGYLNGNAASFEELYRKYRRPLYGYLNSLFPGDTALADDLFQQTWIKVIRNLAKYEERQLFLAYLMRIARNLSIDYCRKNRRHQQLFSDSDGREDFLPEIPDYKDIPGKKMGDRELGAAIRQSLEKLLPEVREVFLMRMEEISFKEIAKVQKCSINTALSRMQYALKSLRKMLGTWEENK